MSRQKPKDNSKSSPERDRCQTPPEAVDFLLDYLEEELDYESLSTSYNVVWEPAAGEGLLAGALDARGYAVSRSDLLDGSDYFESRIPLGCTWQITNPPYSVKYAWMDRAFSLGNPFALLLPSETLFSLTTYQMLEKHNRGLIVLSPSRRINFKMPVLGWNSSATFHTSWFIGNVNHAGRNGDISVIQREYQQIDRSDKAKAKRSNSDVQSNT